METFSDKTLLHYLRGCPSNTIRCASNITSRTMRLCVWDMGKCRCSWYTLNILYISTGDTDPLPWFLVSREKGLIDKSMSLVYWVCVGG